MIGAWTKGPPAGAGDGGAGQDRAAGATLVHVPGTAAQTMRIRRMRVIPLLAAGWSHPRVERELNLPDRWISQRMRNPAFHAEVEAEARRAVADLSERMRRAGSLGIDTLIALAEDRGAPHATRLAAAAKLVEYAGVAAAARYDVTSGGEPMRSVTPEDLARAVVLLREAQAKGEP